MKVEFGRSSGDAEKLVLPGIVYARKGNATHTVYVIALGWWDCHVSLFWHRGANDQRGQSVRSG